jgi:uncharacterized protein (TIGR00156 family)
MQPAVSGTFFAPFRATAVAVAIAVAMAPSGSAVAGESRGGFTGPDNVQSVTVAEASNLPDDTDVRMEGRLVRSLGDEDYEFEDGTGSMTVEIDDDEWQGVEAGPETRVVLEGELDSEQSGMELDVDRVQVLGE